MQPDFEQLGFVAAAAAAVLAELAGLAAAVVDVVVVAGLAAAAAALVVVVAVPAVAALVVAEPGFGHFEFVDAVADGSAALPDALVDALSGAAAAAVPPQQQQWDQIPRVPERSFAAVEPAGLAKSPLDLLVVEPFVAVVLGAAELVAGHLAGESGVGVADVAELQLVLGPVTPVAARVAFGHSGVFAAGLVVGGGLGSRPA